ncbi:probable insulin-like peptide 7 [Lutzomyia longipalpis]|uniref:probable insulin-like peptide 7 n=1 Tax=Lutzomyia longipalpis TaxID=7200 RepID=UPI0024837D09|nr:probable insulin-like peptide 7 [Lutzomyia longipalpis]
MWLQFSAIALTFFLFEFTENGLANQDDALEIIFRQRTQSDWERVWHHESHSRCRERLVRHLFWACEKDIYRLTRRNSVATTSGGENGVSKRQKTMDFPWIESSKALNLLRMRRNHRGPHGASITRECCTRVGCTWEEYAEYCPSNKRMNRK